MVGGKSAQRNTLRLIWGDFLERVSLEGCASNVGEHSEPKEEPGPLVRVPKGDRRCSQVGELRSGQQVDYLLTVRGGLRENQQGMGEHFGATVESLYHPRSE